LGVDELRSELAISSRHAQQLQACDLLGGAALVNVDVCALRADDGSPARQGGLQREYVRASAVEDGKCLGVGPEQLAGDVGEASGPCVRPIGRGVPNTCGGDCSEHLWVRACVIV